MAKKQIQRSEKSKKEDLRQLLDFLNQTYAKLHKHYEDLYWLSYMGDHSVDKKMVQARKTFDEFKSNRSQVERIDIVYERASSDEKKRLGYWKLFFSKHQIPEKVLALKQQIEDLETQVQKKRSKQKEGYINPKTKKFVKASMLKMRVLIRTHDNEKTRKACFKALESLSTNFIEEYIQLVKSRNKFARLLGYEDFYAYNLDYQEGMNKKELFALFDEVYEGTKYVFKELRQLEKKNPKLRLPWNFSYLMSGDFVKEEDPYFKFDEILTRWGRSFSALGINFRQGTLQLDLLDRRGKHNNGFCHWPDLVWHKDGKRIPGRSNFTCNAIFGQVGSGIIGAETLFHEGGHAAHLLNVEVSEICMNSEYPPASTAWAETQSMFLDTMFSSIEWKTRYARNNLEIYYPFSLFEKKLKRLHILAPLRMSSILFVSNFERRIYQAKTLTPNKVKEIAHWAYRSYTGFKYDSLSILNIQHIYFNPCYYYSYGLAELAVAQWREYFYKKYSYIVDNPNIYKEMAKVWKLGSSKTFQKFVKMATGKKLSAKPYLKTITRSLEGTLRLTKSRIDRMKRVPHYNKQVKLNAEIRMVHGKKVIADNKKNFEDMAEKYKAWLRKRK